MPREWCHCGPVWQLMSSGPHVLMSGNAPEVWAEIRSPLGGIWQHTIGRNMLKSFEMHGKTRTTVIGICILEFMGSIFLLPLSVDVYRQQQSPIPANKPMAFCLCWRGSKARGLNSSALVPPACWLAHWQIAIAFPVACSLLRVEALLQSMIISSCFILDISGPSGNGTDCTEMSRLAQ